MSSTPMRFEDASGKERFVVMEDQPGGGVISRDITADEYFRDHATPTERTDYERNLQLEQARNAGIEAGRQAIEREFAEAAEARWREVFSNAGIPFTPEYVTKIDIAPLKHARDKLPGWDELVSLKGATTLPYVDPYQMRKNFTPEVRKGRRERVKEIARLRELGGDHLHDANQLQDEQDAYEPLVQAREILEMTKRLRLFVELWESRCAEIITWAEKDIKKHAPLPAFIKDEIRSFQEQENRWREQQEPKAVPEKPELFGVEPGGGFVQKIRRSPFLAEDGNIYTSEEEYREMQEREERIHKVNWLEDA